jgi:hypothetical protein
LRINAREQGEIKADRLGSPKRICNGIGLSFFDFEFVYLFFNSEDMVL